MEESYTAAHTLYGFGLWQSRKKGSRIEFTSEPVDDMYVSIVTAFPFPLTHHLTELLLCILKQKMYFACH